MTPPPEPPIIYANPENTSYLWHAAGDDDSAWVAPYGLRRGP
jgi:hypothetical protein